MHQPDPFISVLERGISKPDDLRSRGDRRRAEGAAFKDRREDGRADARSQAIASRFAHPFLRLRCRLLSSPGMPKNHSFGAHQGNHGREPTQITCRMAQRTERLCVYKPVKGLPECGSTF